MRRRGFIGGALASGMLPVSTGMAATVGKASEVVMERPLAGKPHAGKVLAAIQPHADDIPIFASGTVAKLIKEGYTGYLIRMTNDDMAGPGTIGDTVLANERDTERVAKALGLKKVFNLNYSNHRMDGESRLEIRERLIFLIRLLKLDTVVCYDPWGHYEENPDHYITAKCVEAACWMAGDRKDYAEHLAAGLKTHSVREKYYFARGPQLVNRVVDISGTIDTKVEANMVGLAQGPGGIHGSQLRKSLAARGLRLPILGNNDDTANRAYIKYIMLAGDAELGKKYGMAYAEQFHYIGPQPSPVEEYVRQHAVKL